jgi:hypothetical protein
VLTCLAAATSTPALAAPASPEVEQTPARAHADVPSGTPSLLLVDDSAHPTAEIRWTDASGTTTRYAADFAYTGDQGRAPMGGNIEAFVAVGGTRLTKGAGHPGGAIVRVGFYKADKARPWFTGITSDTEITVRLTGVRFNQPVDADPRSVVQHLKYDLGDMESCGIPGDARDQFNTADPADTLNSRTRPGVDARLGSLAVDPEEPAPGRGDRSSDTGSPAPLGTASITLRGDDTADLQIAFRYPALRNLRDPWKSDLPGTFLEPVHFHVEFEALPRGTAPLPKVPPAD